jgi:hypothetical protein
MCRQYMYINKSTRYLYRYLLHVKDKVVDSDRADPNYFGLDPDMDHSFRIRHKSSDQQHCFSTQQYYYNFVSQFL